MVLRCKAAVRENFFLESAERRSDSEHLVGESLRGHPSAALRETLSWQRGVPTEGHPYNASVDHHDPSQNSGLLPPILCIASAAVAAVISVLPRA